ncbi:hypothetical protein LUX73_01915 [Actinomadura madurae]|nr:hypothetical protein [Actinomadura madurae]MCQ0003638.1 hypothetical protein [Actinomadura madurae]
MAHQASRAAQVLVQAAHLERDVVQRDLGALGEGQAVVLRRDPEEGHAVGEPVRQPEAQMLLVPGARPPGVGAVQHDMAEPARDGLADLQIPEGLRRDVRGDLDQPAVDVEEPHAVTAAGRVEDGRLADRLHTRRGEFGVQRVDRGGALRGERDDVDALLARLAQADDVGLGAADRPEEHDAPVVGDPVQAPDALVERDRVAEIGHAEPHVTQPGEMRPRGHRRGRLRPARREGRKDPPCERRRFGVYQVVANVCSVHGYRTLL